MKFKAAIFDMDGTLVDSLMWWDILWSKLGKTFLSDADFHPAPEDDRAVRTLTLADAMERVHKKYNMGKSGEELLDFANRMIEDFYKTDVKPKAGVIEFLETLKAENVKMCVATATAPDLVKIALEYTGVGKYFTKVFSCGEIGKGKEEPDVFLLAGEFLGENPCDTWVFEDSLVAIKTATKIGMNTVGIYDKYNFGQDEIKQTATHYIADGETLLKLTDRA